MLRMIILLCLFGVLWGSLSWREAYLKQYLVEQELSLQAEHSMSASFVLEDKTSYQMEFQLEGLNEPHLQCHTVQKLPIKWTFSEDARIKTLNQNLGSYSDCQELKDRLVLSYDLLSKPEVKQYLHILVDGDLESKEREDDRMQVSIRRYGMDFNYGAIDIDMTVLATGFFLFVGLICGLMEMISNRNKL